MNRDAFLARVRAAAESGRKYRVQLRDFPPETGYVGVSGDVCSVMAAEVNAVGGTSSIVADHREARQRLVELLEKHQPRSAICWQHPVLDRVGLNDLLSSKNIARHAHESLEPLDDKTRRSTIVNADIGISSVDYAIAETGTLVVCAKPGQERVASLLPPVHVAIVEQQQIVPDLLDAFERLVENNSRSLPSNVTLITGPSKTGDIELQLTTGVHGPGTWYVIIIRAN